MNPKQLELFEEPKKQVTFEEPKKQVTFEEFEKSAIQALYLAQYKKLSTAELQKLARVIHQELELRGVL